MGAKRKRVTGTTLENIETAEAATGFRFPPSFREWVLINNGLSIDGVWIFPVFDERDPRMTWDSIVRQYANGKWPGEPYIDDGPDYSHLLPFGSYGTGDYYCFDYRNRDSTNELRVVRWSHETGETQERGETFNAFLERLHRGDFEQD